MATHITFRKVLGSESIYSRTPTFIIEPFVFALNHIHIKPLSNGRSKVLSKFCVPYTDEFCFFHMESKAANHTRFILPHLQK